MPPNFSKLKFIDDETKKLIFGYVRNIENLCNVPMAIKHLCLFYSLETEEFGKHSKKLIVSSSTKYKYNDIAYAESLPKFSRSNVFGSIVIDSNKHPNTIYSWTFKLTSNHTLFSTSLPSIGIVSNVISVDDYCFNMYVGGKKHYLYSHYGWDISSGKVRFKNRSCDYNASCHIESGDMIKMEVDLKHKTLKYFQNDKDLDVAFEDIDLNFKYCLAISFPPWSNQVQIIDFSIRTS
eukprot:465483_1